MELSGKTGAGIIAAVVVIMALAGYALMKRSDPLNNMSEESRKNYEAYKSGRMKMPNNSGGPSSNASPMAGRSMAPSASGSPGAP